MHLVDQCTFLFLDAKSNTVVPLLKLFFLKISKTNTEGRFKSTVLFWHHKEWYGLHRKGGIIKTSSDKSKLYLFST